MRIGKPRVSYVSKADANAVFCKLSEMEDGDLVYGLGDYFRVKLRKR